MAEFYAKPERLSAGMCDRVGGAGRSGWRPGKIGVTLAGRVSHSVNYCKTQILEPDSACASTSATAFFIAKDGAQPTSLSA